VHVLNSSESGFSYTKSSLLTMGTNTIPFTITNTGRINVSEGMLDLSPSPGWEH
jgi:hypothetical protein